MKKKKIEHSKPLVDLLHGEGNEGISRRTALKMMGVGGAATVMGLSPSLQAAEAQAGGGDQSGPNAQAGSDAGEGSDVEDVDFEEVK